MKSCHYKVDSEGTEPFSSQRRDMFPSLGNQQKKESSDDSLDSQEKQVKPTEDYSRDDPTNGILFYTNEVEVERSSSLSSQSVVYFGRETTLKVRVVLK